jgi:hypothetical protein
MPSIPTFATFETLADWKSALVDRKLEVIFTPLKPFATEQVPFNGKTGPKVTKTFHFPGSNGWTDLAKAKGATQPKWFGKDATCFVTEAGDLGPYIRYLCLLQFTSRRSSISTAGRTRTPMASAFRESQQLI